MEDWSKLFDQMAKMKYNYYEFWWFAYEPYVQYSYRGEPVLLGDISTKASGYVNTMYEGLGSRTTDDVVIGKQWFPGERLASPEMQHVETPDQAFAVAQDQLQRMIHYAKSRHINMWLVDEMGCLPPNLARFTEPVGPRPIEGIWGPFVDPLDPVNREIQANRLKAMIDTYPEAAGYLLNFPEYYVRLKSAKDLEFFAQPQQQDMFDELRNLMVPWETRWVKAIEMRWSTTTSATMTNSNICWQRRMSLLPMQRSDCRRWGAVTSCRCTTRCCPRTFRSQPLILVRHVDMARPKCP